MRSELTLHHLGLPQAFHRASAVRALAMAEESQLTQGRSKAQFLL
jgi:hypothetical protein